MARQGLKYKKIKRLTTANPQQSLLVEAFLQQAANAKLDDVSDFAISRLQMLVQGRIEDLLVVPP